jgi:hypothetical protein
VVLTNTPIGGVSWPNNPDQNYVKTVSKSFKLTLQIDLTCHDHTLSYSYQTTTLTKGKTMLTKEEIRLAVAHMTKEQLIELVADLTISEQEKREELDKLNGIVR